MPQCPHCQTEYEEGQRDCKICGSYLLHRENGDTLCPQCGIRVSQRQEFCHECDAPLKGEAAAATAPAQELPSPAAAPTPRAPSHPAPPPAPQAPSLKEELQGALSTMREARLKKDIIQLMNCYSVTLPDLEEKRRETLKSWENYDYTNLVFTMDEIQPLGVDNANAKVTWYVDIKNRRTGELISSTQAYQVRFAKELGQWRIRSLEETE